MTTGAGTAPLEIPTAPTCAHAPGCACAAWALSAAISPRQVVRVAEVGPDGRALNAYGRRVRLDAVAPGVPWAVHLADAAGAFHLLGFDLDAHGIGRRVAAAADAACLAGLLQELGIAHVVCASGPSGGRHVWVGLDHGADPVLVASLARLARHVLPTLDVAPLCNAATGCLRPPGSPHRDGGTSTVLAGNVEALSARSTTPGQVGALVAALADLVEHSPDGPAGSAAADAGAGAVVRDEHGQPHLPGPRRALPPAATAAAQRTGGDASATAFSVLLGAARARWRHGDVAELAQSAPGLEHVRTLRGDSGSRQVRPTHGAHSASAVLARQWAKAVATIAATDAPAGEDPTFDARAGAVAELVRGVLARASEVPERWAHGGGPADRRVLQVLCQLALRAVRSQVEVDLRRIGRLGGFSHECARVSLERLATDGWIQRVQPAVGRRAAVWAITPATPAPKDAVIDLTQADPRPDLLPLSPTMRIAGWVPPGVGPAERTALLSAITARIAAFAHDVFTHRALGLAAGNLYAFAPSRPASTGQMVVITGASRHRAHVLLDRLVGYGLLGSDGATWWPGHPDRRDVAAAHLDAVRRSPRREAERDLLPDATPRPMAVPIVDTMARRAAAHRIDQQAWNWWQAELAWRRAPRRTGDARRPGRGQLALVAEEGTHVYGPHPRRADGRADFCAARAILAAGGQSTTSAPPPTATSSPVSIAA